MARIAACELAARASSNIAQMWESRNENPEHSRSVSGVMRNFRSRSKRAEYGRRVTRSYFKWSGYINSVASRPPDRTTIPLDIAHPSDPWSVHNRDHLGGKSSDDTLAASKKGNMCAYESVEIGNPRPLKRLFNEEIVICCKYLYRMFPLSAGYPRNQL